MFWTERPFVRIFFLFLTGILLVVYFPIFRTLNAFLLLSVAFSLLMLSFIFTIYLKTKKLDSLAGFTSALLIIALAVAVTSIYYSRVEEPLSPDDAFYLARIVKEPAASEKAIKVLMQIESYQDTSGLNKTYARVMVFFEKDSLSQTLAYGDEVMFSAKFKQPSKPMNPGEFDYARFLDLNLIKYVAYVRGENWSLVSERNGFSVFAFAAQVRHRLLDELKKNGLSGDEYAVTAAMLLGYDNLMEQGLEQNFRTAGAMHILVVSGLHVGIIYLVLNFLLGFLGKSRKQKIVKMLILLTIVWFYAILTGLAPSVQRSAVMVSMFIFADTTKRFKDNYNTLAASAVLLMLFNPLIIFSVGFQMSYAAVFGILFFYRPIFQLIYIKNKFLRIFWEIIAVSLSAQLGIFPISVHYFHFFPLYFLLTNIVVFPLSFLILTSGLLFVVIFWVPFVSTLVGAFLYYIVYVLNFLIAQIKYFPFSGISDLYFSWFSVVFVYLLIFTLFYWLVLRNNRLALPFFISLFLLLSLGTFRQYQNLQQKSLLIYHIDKHTAIDFIRGDKHVLLADSALLADSGMIAYHLANFLISKNLDRESAYLNQKIDNAEVGLRFHQNIADFNAYRLLIIDENSEYLPGNYEKPKLDAVLITGNNKMDLSELRQCFIFDLIIMDASVPLWKKKKLQLEAETLRIQVYDTGIGGAFIMDF